MAAPIDPRQIEEDRRATIAFVDMCGHTFSGHRQPYLLMEWINMMEIAFEVCHVPERLRVRLAASKLLGHALAWWLGKGAEH